LLLKVAEGLATKTMIMKLILILGATALQEGTVADPAKPYLFVAIGALASVIVFLYIAKEKQNKEWKEKIETIYENHKDDMKNANNDLMSVIERYHKFQEEIKDLIMPRGK